MIDRGRVAIVAVDPLTPPPGTPPPKRPLAMEPSIVFSWYHFLFLMARCWTFRSICLPSFTEFYRVLPVFFLLSGLYSFSCCVDFHESWLRWSVVTFEETPLGLDGYRVFLRFTEFYRVLPGFSGLDSRRGPPGPPPPGTPPPKRPLAMDRAVDRVFISGIYLNGSVLVLWNRVLPSFTEFFFVFWPLQLFSLSPTVGLAASSFMGVHCDGCRLLYWLYRVLPSFFFLDSIVAPDSIEIGYYVWWPSSSSDLVSLKCYAVEWDWIDFYCVFHLVCIFDWTRSGFLISIGSSMLLDFYYIQNSIRFYFLGTELSFVAYWTAKRWIGWPNFASHRFYPSSRSFYVSNRFFFYSTVARFSFHYR